MEFKLPADGIIKKLHKNKPSQIYLNKYDIIVSFDPFTKVDGCTFNHLREGDLITVHQMQQIVTKSTKYFMCQRIVIVDVQKKWNDILKKDKKYCIDHNLASNEYFTRPEIIERSKYHVKNVPINSNMSTRDKKIMELYNKGISSRDIKKQLKLNISDRQVRRIIKSYKKVNN